MPNLYEGTTEIHGNRSSLKRLMCPEKNQYKGWFQKIARGEIEFVKGDRNVFLFSK